MISQLASPSVCVIDDELEDYEPILTALNAMYVSCVHLLGKFESLPEQPFTRVRLVFLDLHLSGAIGKDAASYTANVFRKVISVQTAPILVVIWSKYATDKVVSDDGPVEDQETEAELFKRTLMGAEPGFEGRIIFVEMSKPKYDDRPDDWSETLKLEINKSLKGQSAIELLWEWDGLVTDACARVAQDMTFVAQSAVCESSGNIQDGLRATMHRLAKAPSAGDFSEASAPRHLLSAMTQLLADQLENPAAIAGFASHGAWLQETPPGTVSVDLLGRINGILLTSNINSAGIYTPGTVFSVSNLAGFSEAFGKQATDLLAAFVREKSAKWPEWKMAARPVLIELSPICDLAQGYRVSSLLLGGVVAPASYKECAKSSDAFGALAEFYLRWPAEGFPPQNVLLLYCHRFKITLPAGQSADWLAPWFRIRDLPLAAIRNSNAAHGARVGYISV